MPSRRPRSNELRAIDAIARIHRRSTGRAPENGTSNGWSASPAPRAAFDAEPSRDQVVRRFGPLPNLERPRPGRRVLLAALLVAGIGIIGLGIAGATGNQPRKTHPSSGVGSVASVSHRSSPVTDPLRRGHPSRGHSSTGHSSKSHSSKSHSSTGTSATGTGPLKPTSTAAGSAHYVVSGSSQVTVTISVSGSPCWAEAARQAAGPITWDGTLQPGADQVLAAASSWWIRLGAPANATVTVDGRTLALPGTGDAPVDLDITTS